MKIQLIDEQSRPIKVVECDFDSIMIEAEEKGGEPFSNAIKLIGNLINTKGNFQIEENYHGSVGKYLRKYAAFGYIQEPLTVMVKKVREGLPTMTKTLSDSFEEVITLPNKELQKRYERLVGLDDLKIHIQKEAATIIAPELLEKWSQQFHGQTIQAIQAFRDRYPFFIFEGDVGTGKTEFGTTFGCALAHFIKKNVLLVRMSMKSRGNGVVGEMSKLITKAFHEAKELASNTKGPVILLLDEADSFAQSREEQQMHHEDRAGVNALIQGIDHIRGSSFPILVVFCTNRLGAIDPAIKRRAAFIHTFFRPNFEQRYETLRSSFGDLSLTTEQLNVLARMTGENELRDYGFTYSDLITRVIPQSILNAYPDQNLTFEIIFETVKAVKPTAPFKEK